MDASASTATIADLYARSLSVLESVGLAALAMVPRPGRRHALRSLGSPSWWGGQVRRFGTRKRRADFRRLNAPPLDVAWVIRLARSTR